MSVENHKSFETEELTPLENFFRKMDEEDQGIIEREIFGDSDSIPLSTVFATIVDLGEARIVMRSFSQYIKDRDFISKEQRQAQARDINDYIDRRL
jgi:hypothetical protein